MPNGPKESAQNAISRRFSRALVDLGMHGVFPADWLSFQDDSCHFSPLSFKAVSRLVAHLENAAQLEPYADDSVYETIEPIVKDEDSLKTLVEYHEYQSIPVGYHTPKMKVG
jgi:hypothetical protein